MNNRCVYVWINDTTNKPFYVGCGKIDRPKRIDGRTKSFYEVYDNNKCHYVILKKNLSPEEAAQLERQTIKELRNKGYDLVNQTDGGEIRQYSTWTDDMRKEYSERLTGEANPNFGHHWTKDMKTRLSQIRIDRGIAKGGLNPRAKPVMCVETGEIFSCKQNAGSFLGVANACSSIYFCLKDPKRVAGKKKYHFVGQDMFEELNSEEKRKEWLEKVAS